MNSEWQKFLNRTGVRIDNDAVHPGSTARQEAEAATRETIITTLPYLGLIRIGGKDAATFMQNQFTNDVREVASDKSQLSAWCSPKGRVLACFRLFRTGEYYYMQLPRSLVLSTLEQLRKYILMSEVSLEDCSDAFATIGIAGPQAKTLLDELLPAMAAAVDEVVHLDDYLSIALPGRSPRFILIGEPGRMMPLWSSLKTLAQTVGSSNWRLLDIHAGLPNIYPETAGAFVPQMLNLQAIGGLSLTKGCYPGQEVVARMQYLGKLKRRMYRAVVDTAISIQPGDALLIAGSEHGTGKVVDAHPDASGGYELLAVVEIATVESGKKVCLESNNAAVVNFVDLPYAVAEQSPGSKQ